MFRPSCTTAPKNSWCTSNILVSKGTGHPFQAHSCHARFMSQAKVKNVFNDVFIVGAGCIGQGLTASLIKSNIATRVFLVSKPEHISQIQRTGITLVGEIKKKFTPDDRFVLLNTINPDFLQKHRVSPEPIVFSATKASDATSSLHPFQCVLSNLCPTIICLQNGLGVEQEIERAFPPFHATVLKGHVFGAVHKKIEGIFAYKGKIIVESPNDDFSTKLKSIFGPQDSSIFNLEVSSNILQAIFPKIAVNCVCNPLTVILNQNLGLIRTQYEPLIRMICSEVYAVALSKGVKLASSENLVKIVLDTMSKFSSHYSSMYLDHQAGKASEIEYINGAILKIANEHKIHLPLTCLLTRAMKEIEAKRMTCDSAEEFYKIYESYLSNLKSELFRIAEYSAK